MLNNDLDRSDHADFRHYTGKVFFDPSSSDDYRDGSFERPYRSLAEALVERSCDPSHLPDFVFPDCVLYPAPWSGSTLMLAQGRYADSLSLPGLVGHPIRAHGNGGAKFGDP